MAWRNCTASVRLVEEVNQRWPNRSRVSDGTVGDAAHATRSSDHNPWLILRGEGIVRARDITANGIDAPWLAEFLRQRGQAGDPRLRGGGYIIFNRRITTSDWRGWKTYTGTNPHTSHVHVSFSQAPSGFDSANAWGITNPSPTPRDWFDMATEADLLRVLAEALTPIARRDDIGHARNQIMTAIGIDDPVAAPPMRKPEDNAKFALARRVDVGHALDQTKAAIAALPTGSVDTAAVVKGVVDAVTAQGLGPLVADELARRLTQ